MVSHPEERLRVFENKVLKKIFAAEGVRSTTALEETA
jgi:hypothetical protein